MEKKHAILLVLGYTRTRLSQIYDLTQYGNSLGYTQFHIVETKETAFADLSQRLEQMKCLNTHEHPEYNTILTTITYR
jgi:hypothetical protein